MLPVLTVMTSIAVMTVQHYRNPPQQAWGLHDIPIQQGSLGCNIRDENMSCVEVVVQGGGVGGVRGGWNHWWGWGLVCLLCPVGLLLL